MDAEISNIGRDPTQMYVSLIIMAAIVNEHRILKIFIIGLVEKNCPTAGTGSFEEMEEIKDKEGDVMTKKKMTPKPYHRWTCFKKKENISNINDDDNDNDEIQSMSSSINCQFFHDIELKLCKPMFGYCCWCVEESCCFLPIDNWIDYSKVAPLFDE
ncbi:hypothetical protein RFI_34432 [Reticulomyxa filosa]|uniref:Uncharacterized protein n=1 Tax=Reticulomyxa filosa TaxID=46433 RepID=X6LM25_RETFI|nr:hypothetical protein RFI_34432 [Reticulomyxa filosa]|eukprot:ETO02978.1 hypothetical protein RFI_34432 [Reticulomyxa filosa]